MSRRWLLVPLVVVALLAIVGTAGVVVAPNLLKPRLEAAITAATGHAATIRGGIRLGWSGGPELRVNQLVVANAPWGSRPDMLVVPVFAATVDLSALWGGVIRIGSVRLENPDLLLETNAAGQGNWQRPPQAPPPAAPAPAPPNASPSEGGGRVQVGTVTLAGGHAAYRDGKTGRLYAAGIDGTAKAAAEPVPVDVTLTAEAISLHLVGTLDRTAPLQRSALGVTGQVRLPPDTINLAARLTPGQAGQSVVAQARGAGLQASVTGVMDPATLRPVGPVTLDAALADGSPLPARFGFPGLAGASSLHVLTRQQGEGISLRELRATMPAGDVGGDLDVAFATPVSVKGALSSRQFDLARLLASFAPGPAPAPAPAPASAPPPPAPVAPAASPALPLAVLDRANADLRLTVAELRDDRVTVRDLAGHLVLQDGKLTLDPFAGTGPGGTVALTVHADGRAVPPALAVTLHAPALEIQPFIALAQLPGDVRGAAAIDADLRATGATQPALLQTLAGTLSVRMVDGDIDLRLLQGVLSATKLPIDPRTRAHLRCLLVRASLTGGVANLDPLLVDASQVLVQGTGSVNLVQQTMALRLRPLVRTGPGIVVPVTVTGAWAKPKFDLDRADLAGALTGLLQQAADPCRAAGVASAAPPPAAKPLKPAELLKGLLR